MLGNVDEWVGDWFRGCGWNANAGGCRALSRGGDYSPDDRISFPGFRLLRTE